MPRKAATENGKVESTQQSTEQSTEQSTQQSTEQATEQATKFRVIADYRQALSPIESTEYIFDNPQDIVVSTDETTSLVITRRALKNNNVFRALDFYDDLANNLGVVFNNFGIAIYDSESGFKFSSKPIICLNKQGIPVLTVGMYLQGKYEPTEIPLCYVNGSYYFANSKGQPVKDSLPIALSCINGVDVKIPVMVFKTKGFTHLFIMKYQEGVSYEHLEYAFENGEIDTYLDKLFGEQASLTKMFLPCFKGNYFPTNGVAFQLTFSKITDGFNKKSEERQTVWSIDSYSCSPDLLVKTFGSEATPISEVSKITCSATSQVTKQYFASGVKTIILMVLAPNPKRVDHTPNHVVATAINRIMPKTKERFAAYLSGLTLGNTLGEVRSDTSKLIEPSSNNPDLDNF